MGCVRKGRKRSDLHSVVTITLHLVHGFYHRTGVHAIDVYVENKQYVKPDPCGDGKNTGSNRVHITSSIFIKTKNRKQSICLLRL